MGKKNIALVFCLISTCSVLLSPAQSVAQSDSRDHLCTDSKLYVNKCESDASRPLSSDCAKEKVELANRQHAFNMTDDDLRTCGDPRWRGPTR
jgi:hypothetical protein